MTRHKYNSYHADIAFEVADMSPPANMNWRDAASCSDAMAFAFPEEKSLAERNAAERDFARAYCRSCLVKEECLYTGVTLGSEDGVWGGHPTNVIRLITAAYKDIANGGLRRTRDQRDQNAS
jgi:hypothetical protein